MVFFWPEDPVSWHKPSPQTVWRAIEIYVQHAYDGPPPSAVRARIDTLHQLPPADFYDNPILEPDSARPPRRYTIRLGNSIYPHMKLAIARTPDGRGYLFHVDTHDEHCRPEQGSRETKAFHQLMNANSQVAQRIENAWAEAGLPTFKTYLRDDLLRRQVQAQRIGG